MNKRSLLDGLKALDIELLGGVNCTLALQDRSVQLYDWHDQLALELNDHEALAIVAQLRVRVAAFYRRLAECTAS